MRELVVKLCGCLIFRLNFVIAVLGKCQAFYARPLTGKEIGEKKWSEAATTRFIKIVWICTINSY